MKHKIHWTTEGKDSNLT